MYIVRELLETKGYDVWTISPESTVYDALALMAEKNVGALLVMDGERLVGIFSERDYSRKVILRGKSSRTVPIHEIMTEKVYYVQPGDSVEGCMALMTKQRIRHLPVLENEQVIGVISIGDVVKAYISQQADVIEHLANYITTGYPQVTSAVDSDELQ